MPDWSMAIAPDVGTNAYNAFRQGQMEGEQRRAKNALAAYATNPNEDSLNALAPYQPEFVMQQKQQMQAQQQKRAEMKLVGDALAHPDPAARQMARHQLAYTNSDLYLRLGAEQKQAVDGLMKAIGQQAFSIMQLPKEQQEPALQQALQGLQAQGIDTSGFHLTGNPDVDLRTALAISGQLDDFEKFAQPDYVPIGEGGLAGFQYGKPIQQNGQVQNFGSQAARPQSKAEYDALPNGAQYVAPDGSVRTKGGPSQSATGGFQQ